MPIAIDRRGFLRLSAAGVALAGMPGLVRRANASAPLIFQASWINDAEFTGYFVAADDAKMAVLRRSSKPSHDMAGMSHDH